LVEQLDGRKQIVYNEVSMIDSGLRPIHPGEFLAEILSELDISQAEFARAIGVSPMRISHVVNQSRPITAELALLFGRALGQSPQYWLNLQADFDLKKAEAVLGERLLLVRELAPV
jgi:addiction module HigA family antidote